MTTTQAAIPIRFVASPDISRALVMAMAGHNGQVRMGTSLPYITHPISVAMAVAARGGSEAEIIAALFHDAVEDTLITVKQIRRAFGDEVADLVEGMTKPEGMSKMDNVRRIATSGNLKLVLLKIDDTSHNLSDLDPESSLYAFYQRSMEVLETARILLSAQEAAA